jgi:hypothetical protein
MRPEGLQPNGWRWNVDGRSPRVMSPFLKDAATGQPTSREG